jgi:DNA-directed RNA polymerase subunit F
MAEEKNYLEILDALTDALGSSEDQSLEEVREELLAEGIDVDASVNRLMQTVNSCIMSARREAMDRAREERLKAERKDLTFGNKFANLSKDQLLEKIKEIMSISHAAPILSFRDLELKSDEDLASILEDLELAKQLADKEQNRE